MWHRRLGHLSLGNMRKVSKMVNGVPDLKYNQNGICDICVEGKQAKLPFGGTRPRTTRPLERVHSELCGPISSTAYNGVK